MIRASAFKEIDGFIDRLKGGEEPELCFRLRRKGWKILKINESMALHDAQKVDFRQWWLRQLRFGHACCQIHFLHRNEENPPYKKEFKEMMFWGLLLPMLILMLAPYTFGVSFLLVFFYFARIYLPVRDYLVSRDYNRADARAYALDCTLGKIPQALGCLKAIIAHSKKGS
jgi:GT2 family glycosyltransferase